MKKVRKKSSRPHIPGQVVLATPKKSEVDAFEAEVYKFEFLVETALPKGQCTVEDLQLILDNVNLCALILSRPKSRAWLDEPAVSESVPDVLEAMKALETLTKRCVKTGSSTCTAQELNAIRKGALYAGEVIHRSLEECPMKLFKEFFIQKKLLAVGKLKRVRVNVDKFEELVRTPWVDLKRNFGGLL